MQEKEPKKLSASRIAKYNDCSYAYYCDYELKLPKTSNDGARRGTIVHLIYSLLLKDRHKKHFHSIHKTGKVESAPSIVRLIRKHARKENILDPENLDLIKDFIVRGLKDPNFLCEDALKVESERKFIFKTDDYAITGFIDKRAIYPDKIVIKDYKTSKEKYSEAEIDGNVQALMYSLITYKETGVIPDVDFIFLKFDDGEIKTKKCSVRELEGFEQYLKELSKNIQNFTEVDARGGYAADKKDKLWLCGRNKSPGQLKKDGTLMWGCEFKFAFDYYVLLDNEGKVLKSAFDAESLAPEKDQFVEKKRYHGCPRWNRIPKNDEFI